MNTIERKIAPNFSNPKAPEILLPERTTLQNIPLFIYRKQEWEVSRLVWCIPGGSASQKKKLAAAFTARMLSEGTTTKTSAEIADYIDFFGAFLDIRSDEHYTFVTLYCMNKHLSSLIPLIFEIMHEATFPENELEIEVQNTIQEFLINNEKVAAVSRRIFPSLMFGKEHPYGRYADISDFESISRSDLINHYQSTFHFEKSFFVLSGKVENEDLQCLEKELMGFPFRSGSSEIAFNIETSEIKKHHVEKDGALQTAIRIGKIVIPQSHPDFPALVLGNTLLGGYFGSRLMSNIREEKGLTYGIGSAIISRRLASYAAIITEVKAENTALAIDEIFFELNRLISEKIEQNELDLVKNYIIGSGLKGFDGPIQLAERFVNLYCMNIDFADYYKHFFEQIMETREEKVREVLNKYLNPKDMIILSVGKE